MSEVYKCPICHRPFVTEDQLQCHHMLQECPICREPKFFYALHCGHCFCMDCLSEFKNRDSSPRSSNAPSENSSSGSSYVPSESSQNTNHSPQSNHQIMCDSEHSIIDLSKSPASSSDENSLFDHQSASSEENASSEKKLLPCRPNKLRHLPQRLRPNKLHHLQQGCLIHRSSMHHHPQQRQPHHLRQDLLFHHLIKS